MAIEPVRRSFAILEALSRRPHATIAALAGETGLPRPTVVRLLGTLVEVGYAVQVSRSLGYRLTDRVLTLAQGIRFIDHLVDIAAPHMQRFTQEHGWPLYLGSISHRAITIRHSTAPESPMAFEAAALNTRRSVLLSALGRVWLAFSGPQERRATLRDSETAALGARATAALDEMLARIRRDGWAFTARTRSRIHGMAVPIRNEGRMLGSLSMRFPHSAMSEDEAASRFGHRLVHVARTIASDVVAARDSSAAHSALAG